MNEYQTHDNRKKCDPLELKMAVIIIKSNKKKKKKKKR